MLHALGQFESLQHFTVMSSPFGKRIPSWEAHWPMPLCSQHVGKPCMLALSVDQGYCAAAL